MQSDCLSITSGNTGITNFPLGGSGCHFDRFVVSWRFSPAWFLPATLPSYFCHLAFYLFYLLSVFNHNTKEKMSSIPTTTPAENAPRPEDEVPWWMKYAGRGLGTFGGVVAMALGVWTCVSFSPICIVAGIWQICAGFIVVLAEAPCCCMFLDFVQQFTNFVERRPVWNKAVAYIVISLPSITMCAGLSTFLGSACIFATGVIYGLMSLGKKASRGEMLSRAQTDFLATTLVKNMEVPVPTQPVP